MDKPKVRNRTTINNLSTKYNDRRLMAIEDLDRVTEASPALIREIDRERVDPLDVDWLRHAITGKQAIRGASALIARQGLLQGLVTADGVGGEERDTIATLVEEQQPEALDTVLRHLVGDADLAALAQGTLKQAEGPTRNRMLAEFLLEASRGAEAESVFNRKSGRATGYAYGTVIALPPNFYFANARDIGGVLKQSRFGRGFKMIDVHGIAPGVMHDGDHGARTPARPAPERTPGLHV